MSLVISPQHAAVAAGQASFDVVDLAEHGLPLLDEPVPAMFGDYRHPHTRRWARTIASLDGFVFVTPEYNRGMPAALKNAIDYLFAEWSNKAAGFVSHGVHGGTRAVEQLRLSMTELQVANVRTQVALSAFTDFELTGPTDPGVITPGPHQEETLVELMTRSSAGHGRSGRCARTPRGRRSADAGRSGARQLTSAWVAESFSRAFAQRTCRRVSGWQRWASASRAVHLRSGRVLVTARAPGRVRAGRGPCRHQGG
ncbi:NADPH-dependent FMN reductase [Nonomuraea sp. KM88]|uniref:NADPH-dependent FMN reductase n=1 Tax=Nonomuraea sp. KM88 TaxID=3457427 RepID=UPI003FCCBE9E